MQRQFKRVVLRLPHRERLVRHFDHALVVDPVELHGFYLYYEREYDDYIFRFLLPRLGSFGRALDIGANIGIYTVFLAQHIPRVDAFEPEPSVLTRLRKNLSLNNVANVSVHETCVGLESGTVAFLEADERNQGIGRIASESADVEHRRCVSLDDFLHSSIDEPCLIKMDIEGAELLAIQGGRQAFANRSAPVSILIETHPAEIAQLGGTLERLAAGILELGLRVSALTPRGLEPLDLASVQQRFWWAEG